MNNISGNSGNETGDSTPNIPGPYHSPEQTEAFPLKQSLYRGANRAGTSRSRGWSSLAKCCNGSSDQGGTSLRIIILCFVTLTLAVIIALAIQIYYGDYQLVPHGSVATDSRECSFVGTDILKVGGNAVDAAIASTFCMGVVNPHVTGLGGGGFMIIYSHRLRKMLDIIDFREVAPAAIDISVDVPGSLVGVPGLLRGMAMAHQRHGKLPWKDIVMKAVKIARTGFHVPQTLVQALSQIRPNEFNADLAKWNTLLEPGKTWQQPDLAATLELIAEKGPDVLYNGSLAKGILMAVAKAGGKMTEQDLAAYQPVRRSTLETTFADFNILVPDLPSGGPALLALLELIPQLNTSLQGQELSPIQVVSLANASAETFKSALDGVWGDPDFSAHSPDHPGGNINFIGNMTESVGSHIAAVDFNDIFVSVVSGLNTWFGSQLLTNHGFVLNNALTSFGVGMNNPMPGKRPMSMATPFVAVEKRRICGHRFVLGSGDATLAAQLLLQLVVFDKNLTHSVEAPRFQVYSSNIYLEDYHSPPLGKSEERYLSSSGYHINSLLQPYRSCNVVEKLGDNLASHSDSRGGGVSSRF